MTAGLEPAAKTDNFWFAGMPNLSIKNLMLLEKDGLTQDKYLQPFGYNLALKTYPLNATS